MIAIAKKAFFFFLVLSLLTIAPGSPEGIVNMRQTAPTAYTIPSHPKHNIDELINQNNLNLEIQQQGGKRYKASQYFTVRVIEMLRRYTPVDQIKDDQSADQVENNKIYDLKLYFKGYDDICMNSHTGMFRFEGDSQVYTVESWSDEYWKRYILKEINGELIYSSFERDIIAQNSNMDIDKDGKSDAVILYYDGDIRLEVKDSDVPVLVAASPEAISSIVPSNQYNCNLYTKEDPANDRYQFLAGITYSFTNKYGSTSWLSCYEYKNGTLEKTWSSGDELSREIKTADYKNGILTVNISGLRGAKKIILNAEQKEAMQKYMQSLKALNKKPNWQDITFETLIMPQYRFYDYDNDGEDELITYSVLQGGPPSCLGDTYYSIYKFTSSGIALIDSFFASYNNSLGKVFF